MFIVETGAFSFRVVRVRSSNSEKERPVALLENCG